MSTEKDPVLGAVSERPGPRSQWPPQPARKRLNPHAWHPKLASFVQLGIFGPVEPAVIP
jgi:hypothetical protein